MNTFTKTFSAWRQCLSSGANEPCYTLLQDTPQAVSCLQSRAREHQAKNGRALRQAPFQFLALPAEVRVLVYKVLFRGHNIHCRTMTTKTSSHLGIWSCSIPSPCSCTPPQTLASKRPWRPRANRSYLAILQTCRLIHAEADPVLFRVNTFVVHDITALMRLQHHDLARGVHEIRSLRMTIDLDQPINGVDGSYDYIMADWHWCLLWRPLETSFPALRHLRVELGTADVAGLVDAVQAKSSPWMAAIERSGQDVRGRRKLESVRFEFGLPKEIKDVEGVSRVAVERMARRLERMFLPEERDDGGSALIVGDVVEMRKDSGCDLMDDRQLAKKMGVI